ncbi:MAG TPA: hypothetical protein VEN30_06445 [Paraburkholderia sp.]|nr:hypothetical protein [Paraburkholderia sp.]
MSASLRGVSPAAIGPLSIVPRRTGIFIPLIIIVILSASLESSESPIQNAVDRQRKPIHANWHDGPSGTLTRNLTASEGERYLWLDIGYFCPSAEI